MIKKVQHCKVTGILEPPNFYTWILKYYQKRVTNLFQFCETTLAKVAPTSISNSFTM